MYPAVPSLVPTASSVQKRLNIPPSPQSELMGKPVLAVYVPDDKTKFQLLPYRNDLPFSPIIPFSPLGVRKDGSIMRLATRLQMFSNHRLKVGFSLIFCTRVHNFDAKATLAARLQPDWTIIVVDGIEEVSPSLGTSSIMPHLPKWLGQNTAACTSCP